MSFVISANSYTNQVFVPNSHSRIVFRRHHFLEDCRIVDAHSRYWSLALHIPSKNSLGIIKNHQEETIDHGPVVILLPPFSVVEWSVKKGEYRWVYLLSPTPWPTTCPQNPSLLKHFSIKEVHRLIKKGLVEDVFSWVSSQKYFESLAREGAEHIVADKLKSWIDQNFQTKIPLMKWQEFSGCASAVSTRLFKKKYGVSPSDYRNQLRMKQASFDLLFYGATVEEARLKIGIEDSSHFYKSFKHYINATPGIFRS